MERLLSLVAALAVVSASGCGFRKAHLIKGFGTSNDAAFAAQRGPDRPAASAATGLDPQEAAIIAEGYRAGLAPPGATVKTDPVLILAPQGREGARPLAPSVPKD